MYLHLETDEPKGHLEKKMIICMTKLHRQLHLQPLYSGENLTGTCNLGLTSSWLPHFSSMFNQTESDTNSAVCSPVTM